MAFNRVLQTNAVVNDAVFTAYRTGVFNDSIGGLPNSGFTRTTLCNRTRNFRPGVFSINPIKSWVRSYSSVGSPLCSQELYYNGIWRELRFFGGHPCRRYNPAPYTLNSEWVDTGINYDRVLMDAARKVASPQADVALMLAELGETAQMLRNALNALRNPWMVFWNIPGYYSQWSTKKFASYMSSRWLEYRYGLTPFLKDVEDLRNIYKKRSLRTATGILKKSSKLTLFDKVTLEQDGSYGRGSPYNYAVSWRIRQSESQVLTSHVYYRNSVQFDTLGFSIDNIPNILWELVPYSFVIDWFFGVGDWLKACVPKPGVSHLGFTIGIKRVLRYRCMLKDIVYTLTDAPWRWKGGKAPNSFYNDEQHTYIRNIGDSLPTFPLVDYGINNLKHFVDSASLSWQKLAKLTKR